MIQNVSVKSNDTRAQVTWDTQEGPMLKIDLRFVPFALSPVIDELTLCVCV